MARDCGGTGPSRNATRKRRQKICRASIPLGTPEKGLIGNAQTPRRLFGKDGFGSGLPASFEGSTGQAFTYSQDAGQRLQLLFGPARVTSHTHHFGMLTQDRTKHTDPTFNLREAYEALRSPLVVLLVEQIPRTEMARAQVLDLDLKLQSYQLRAAPGMAVAVVEHLTRYVLPDTRWHVINAALRVLGYE